MKESKSGFFLLGNCRGARDREGENCIIFKQLSGAEFKRTKNWPPSEAHIGLIEFVEINTRSKIIKADNHAVLQGFSLSGTMANTFCLNLHQIGHKNSFKSH